MTTTAVLGPNADAESSSHPSISNLGRQNSWTAKTCVINDHFEVWLEDLAPITVFYCLAQHRSLRIHDREDRYGPIKSKINAT